MVRCCQSDLTWTNLASPTSVPLVAADSFLMVMPSTGLKAAETLAGLTAEPDMAPSVVKAYEQQAIDWRAQRSGFL